MRTDFDFRRTVTTLVFCGAGMAMLPVLVWMTYLVRSEAPLVYRLAMGVIGLLAIVLIGLSFTVAMRQIGAKFGKDGAEFSASGGQDEGSSAPRIVTTTETKVEP